MMACVRVSVRVGARCVFVPYVRLNTSTHMLAKHTHISLGYTTVSVVFSTHKWIYDNMICKIVQRIKTIILSSCVYN